MGPGARWSGGSGAPSPANRREGWVGKPARESHLEQRAVKPYRCLNFPEPTLSLNAWSPCYAVWFQSFRFLRVAAVSCEVPVGYRICGGRLFSN